VQPAGLVLILQGMGSREIKPEQVALHLIYLAHKIKSDLDSRKVNSYSEAEKLFGLSRARICRILKLLKLPEDIREFLLEARNP
jgi:hypothetical protein